ncbi:hypothetical protein [Emticicia sp. SJ17W-69]|uniref:hypothetical protein n=1 Tax=Emticicia sp. SJ17W-69 TaxID=3421657 RepID=UPI003EC09BDD
MKKINIKKRNTNWSDLDDILRLLKGSSSTTDDEIVISRIKQILFNPRYASFTYEYDSSVIGFSFLEKYFYIDISSTFVRVIMFLMKEDLMKEEIERKMIEDAKSLVVDYKMDGLYNTHNLTTHKFIV